MLDLQEAISLLEKGDARQAADLLEEMAAEMPGYATARVLLARAYEGLNDWDRALVSWRDALHIIPNSPVVRRGMARAARKVARKSPIDRPAEAPPSEPPSAEEAPANGPRIEPPLTVEVPDEDEGGEEDDFSLVAEPEEAADALEQTAKEPTVEPPSTEPEVADESTAEFEDLDRLISELESARIIPRPDLDDLPPPELEDDIEDVVSETLARIYASQDQYDEAARVYELLADQQPSKSDEFLDKASEMRSRASEQG